MTLRDSLQDILKNTLPSIPALKVTGTNTSTIVQGVDAGPKGAKVFMLLDLTTPIPEFEGEFGIANLSILKSLMNLPSYKADAAITSVKRRPWNDATTVETIEFRDINKVGVDFRCMPPERVPQQNDPALLLKIPFDLTIRPTKEKLAEFTQLANVFGSPELKEELFGLKVQGNNLMATFGADHATTHRGSMVFEENITMAMTKAPLWSHKDFLDIMKMAGSSETVVRYSEKAGVLGVEIKASVGSFKYYLRTQQR